MTGPFELVPMHRRMPLARAFAVAALTFLILITVLSAPLRGDVAPLGIVSLQVAGSPEVAAAILDSWAAVPRARLLWAHGLDHVFPFAYAGAIGLAAATISGRSRSAVPASAVAAGGALVAAVADQVENLAMWVTILQEPGWASVLVTLAAATVKFAALALALGALLLTYRNSRIGLEGSIA